MRIDVHQHLWPEPFLDALRRRSRPPRLEGWTLHLQDAPPFSVDPADHDPERRVALAAEDGLDLALVAPSAALGLSDLPSKRAGELAAAWEEGVAALPAPFRAWTMTALREPDLRALAAALDAGCVGLELPATAMATPAAVERLAPLLELVEAHGRALLVHPGPAPEPPRAPGWWSPVVPYVQQLHAAWWAWWEAGRSLLPRLPVVFAALAGLAPLHGERHRVRGGAARPVDPATFVETSCYGPQAVDATLRVLGVDVVCLGSDRPYAPPAPLGLGAAVQRALGEANPERLLAAAPAQAAA